MAKKGRRPGGNAGGNESGGAEDEGTGLFFLLAIISCIIVPWTLIVLRRLLTPGRSEISQAFPDTTEDGFRVRHCKTKAMVEKREAQVQSWRSRGRFFTRSFVLRLVILALLWCWLIYIIVQIRKVMSTSALYQNFDPYEILGVGRSVTNAGAKKAFRKLAVTLHPDKNPSKDAATQFILVKKAYDALTDPMAKRNYELYGNPDGPTRMEIGVAIPLAGKDSQGLILVLFVIFFIIGVPLTALWCMGGGSDTAGNGVLNDTMDLLNTGVTATLDSRAARDLVAKSGESSLCTRETTEEDKQAVGNILKELGSNARTKQGESVSFSAMKGEMLLLAHLHRRHDLLSQGLAADMEELLPKWQLVSMALAELAARRSTDSTLAALRLHRRLVQGLDNEAPTIGPMPLLQVPHFTDERIKQWRKGPRKAASLPALLELPADERRSSLEAVGFQPEELLDVEEFALALPRLAIKEVKVFVDGENNICAGDIATLEVTLVRENLREGEAAGSVHAPLFPICTAFGGSVPEAWWVAFATSSKGTVPSWCARVESSGREFVTSMKFKVQQPGRHRCTLRIISEAYEGLDLEQPVTFEAKQPTEVHDDSDDQDSDEAEDDE